MRSAAVFSAALVAALATLGVCDARSLQLRAAASSSDPDPVSSAVPEPAGAVGDDANCTKNETDRPAAPPRCAARLEEFRRTAANETGPRIPRLIHQSWKSSHIPAHLVPWMRSWVAQNPDWCYVFWSDGDNDRLIAQHFRKYLRLARLLKGVKRADFSRYALLFHFGGLYADADFECLRPFDKFRHLRAFIGTEPLAHAKLLHKSSDGFLCNALMASEPRHPFWLALMERIKGEHSKRPTDDATSLTGPKMLHATFRSMDPKVVGVTEFSEEYFYPEVAFYNDHLKTQCKNITDFNRNECRYLKKHPKGRYTENTHAVHHWQCSWCRNQKVQKTVPITDIVPPHMLVQPTVDNWL